MDAAESADRAGPELAPARWPRRLLISLFIAFNLIGIINWNLPSSYSQSLIRAQYYPYMNYLGITQNWGMFAPEPGHENFYMVARITYADGHVKLWELGRQDDLNNWDRLVNERQRKMVENLYDTSNGTSDYPQMSLWVARRNPGSPGDPPVRVELMRYWCPIPAPPNGIDEPIVSQWLHDTVYSTTINSGGHR